MDFSKKVKLLFNSDKLEENIYSLANYLSSLVRVNSNNLNIRNNSPIGIDMRDEKVKEFYDIYPEIIRYIFTSNGGLIEVIEERVTFKEYDFLLQLLSPKTFCFSLMEFIMSSKENNFTYDFSNKLTRNDSSLYLYEIKDFSYICSNFSTLKDTCEYDILNNYILTAFPRMSNTKLFPNDEKIKKSSLLATNEAKSSNLSFLRKSLTGLKNTMSLTNSNSSNHIEKIYVDPYEYFIINLLFYMKNCNSRLKVKSLENENSNFKNIKLSDNSFGNYQLNPNSTSIHINTLDLTKSVIANFISRLFMNIFEYLSNPTSEDEYINSNYNHSNSFLDLNQFIAANDLLKKRRLRFTCIMINFTWLNEFYMRKMLKNNIMNEAIDLSSLNILVLDNLIFAIRQIQKEDYFISNNTNSIYEFNNDNMISATLSTPIFYLLKFMFDYFTVNNNLISKLHVTIYNAMDIFKAYILPWNSLDKEDIINSLMSINHEDIKINITHFIYFNIQFYTYLFNKFVICLSSVSDYDLNFMIQLNEILSLYNQSESNRIFFNRLDYNIFEKTLAYFKRNEEKDKLGNLSYDRSQIEIYEVLIKNFKVYDLSITEICPWNIMENRKKVFTMVGRWANFVENNIIYNPYPKSSNSIINLSQEEKDYNLKLQTVIQSNISILNSLYKLHSLGENDKQYSGRKSSIYGNNYNNFQEINDTFVLNEIRSKSKNEYYKNTPENKNENNESRISDSKTTYSTEENKFRQIKRLSRTNNNSEIWESNLGSDENFILYIIFLFLAMIIDSIIAFATTSYLKITSRLNSNLDSNNEIIYKSKEIQKSKYPKTNLRYFVNKYNFLSTILVISFFYLFLKLIR